MAGDFSEVAVRWVLGLKSSEGLIWAGGSTSTHMAGKLVPAVGERTQSPLHGPPPWDLLGVLMEWLLASAAVRYERPRWNYSASYDLAWKSHIVTSLFRSHSMREGITRRRDYGGWGG